MRAAGAEDDVRPDQPGEEHDLGGQEQPHRDLAGRDRRRVGRGRAACPAGFGWVELWVAIAIVKSTLRNVSKGDCTGRCACRRVVPGQNDSGLSSSRSRIAGK